MTTNFKISGLSNTEFIHFFHLSSLELKKIGAKKMIVDSNPGFPCRISLEDAQLGEEVILLPYQYHKTASAYQASGPIFIRNLTKTAHFEINEIPKMLFHRLLSLRGYNQKGFMKEATVTEGNLLKEQLNEIFKNPEIKYIHIHNAKPGCFNCKVERV